MYSFDVFDTLITRRTADPKGIFMLMQELIQFKNDYDIFLTTNFYELRIESEKLARVYAKSIGKLEVTLDDIYSALATTACVTEIQQEILKKIEVELEHNCVLAIPLQIKLLRELKAKGEHIVLISDMYLDEIHIRNMLCQVDPVFKEIPLYVSSAYGKTKGSGELFKIVQKQEHVDFTDWVHYGDNQYADIDAALKLGIKAMQVYPESAKEYEQAKKDCYYQISVGASRYVRSLKNYNISSEVGSSLAGPILYPYVKWILEESVKRGIDRLYFVARDGWILQQMADIIVLEQKYPIKTYYIYGSRKVWRLSSFDGTKEDFNRILKWSNIEEVISLADLAGVFQLKVDELRDFLPEEFYKVDSNQSLLNIQIDNLCRHLRENVAFMEYLIKSQTEKKSTVIRYLKQELDVSDDKFAFVELAGTGLTQKLLARIIGNFYSGQIRNFYFKLDSIHEEDRCKFLNFYPSDLERSFMLELLCRAPHGQTEDYIEKDGKIIPVLEKTEGEQIKAYYIEEYRDAVLAYVKQMEDIYRKGQFTYVPKLDIVKEYMEVITINPPERIAEYFCHMPFSSGGRKNAKVEFAPAVSKKQLREVYFWNDGRNPIQFYHGNNLDYALAVSPSATKYKKKCIQYRKSRIGKWLVYGYQYLHTHQKPGTDYFCPWEFLTGNIVIYGAGKVGQSFVKQAKQKYAKCNKLLWVDSNYAVLQKNGLDVHSPEDILEQSFDRIIIAIHNSEARQEIWDKLLKMGIHASKIYFG